MSINCGKAIWVCDINSVAETAKLNAQSRNIAIVGRMHRITCCVVSFEIQARMEVVWPQFAKRPGGTWWQIERISEKVFGILFGLCNILRSAIQHQPR